MNLLGGHTALVGWVAGRTLILLLLLRAGIERNPGPARNRTRRPQQPTRDPIINQEIFPIVYLAQRRGSAIAFG